MSTQVGKRNLQHVLTQIDCTDPDCELHNPEVIETLGERFTALAWYFAGAMAAGRMLEEDPEKGLIDLIALRIANMGEDL